MSTTKLKFVKVDNWYGNLARYEARLDHPHNPGTFVIEAAPSTVYEGRLSGYTVAWVSDTDARTNPSGAKFGSINTGFGRGERKLAEAKAAAQAWRDNIS